MSALFTLDNKIAVVTGGCGRLGPWWIKALLSAGANVVSLDVEGSRTPEEFEKSDGRVLFVTADVTDPDSLTAAHMRISKQWGSVDVLVNNAGIDVRPIKIAETQDRKKTQGRYQKMWDVNVQGAVNCIEEFVTDMKEKKRGSIINIGSLYASVAPHESLYDHLGFDKPWAYGATKSAVVQVTRHYAARLGKYAVRVNTLSPGGVQGEQDPEFIRKYSQRVPMERMAQKETDLAGPLLFLASDASSYVTGVNIPVDGGYTAW